jgi:hypothetical protein
MNNKYFTVIIIILGLILLGIFTAWFLVNRGYIQLNSTNNPSNTIDSAATNSLFPTGGGENSNSTNSGSGFVSSNSNSATSSVILSGNQLDKQLTKLDTSPIGALLAVGKATSTILFFERATGHLFQIPPSGSPFRLTNTTMPKVVAAGGGMVGSTTNFIIRTNNYQWETKFASLTNSIASSSSLFLGTEDEVGSMPQTLTVKPSPVAAFDFAISPLENQIAYLEHTPENTNLIVTNWDNSKWEKVASLPVTQTNLTWSGIDTITIQTKASYTADGLLYFYNLKTKKLDKIISGVKGLSTKVSPDARYVLYSGSNNGTLFAALYDRRTGKIDRLPFKTLAEKCVWSRGSDLIYCGAPANAPSGDYPDVWYQGSTSLKDNLWELEVATKKATLLFNPELNNLSETIDATQLTLDEVNQQLYFINKNDFSLWRLTLGTGF